MNTVLRSFAFPVVLAAAMLLAACQNMGMQQKSLYDRLGGKDAITVPAVELSRGLVIGVLERTLALTLVLASQFSALGLILAAKAIVRYQALDDRDFAEYVLIGTLTSILIALFVGLGIRTLLS